MNYGHPSVMDGILSLLVANACDGESVEWIAYQDWALPNQTYLQSVHNSTQIDMLPELWVMSPSRNVTFSHIVYHTQQSFVFPSDRAVEEPSNLWAMSSIAFSAFSPHIWLALILVFYVLVAFNSRVVSSLFHRSPPSKSSTSWNWFGHYILQNTSSTVGNHLTLSSKVVLIMTALFSLHSLSLYQGCLLTKLVHIDRYIPPIRDLDDVVERVDSGTAVLNFHDPNTAVIAEIQDPTSQYSRLREPLLDNPPVYLLDKVDNFDDDVDIISVAFHLYLMLDIVTPENCSFVEAMVEDRVDVAFVFSKQVEQDRLQCFNDALLQQYGQVSAMIQRAVQRKQNEYDWCREAMFSVQSPLVGHPIRVMQLTGAGVMLGVGMALAIGCFGVEVMRTRLA